ncbi:hypothetical protein FNJ87_00330 [Nonlabens mediterrranea]|uniref:Lipopolysaccharide biosynthesis protein n=1 Tax=Nonlabens mediterrranea TaxID=1419947 RepID=A0ABS0A0H2_9FLAO|nr:hypothetical protein [Nonlabens mediterrranea]
MLKVASFNGVYILIKIAIGAIMSRIIADYAGAAGMAIMGNLRNFTQGIQTFAILGIEHGLVKYAAAYRKDYIQLKNYYKTAWLLSIFSSCILATILLLALHVWFVYKALQILGHPRAYYGWLIALLLITIFTGILMNYVDFPFGSQAAHLVLASIILGLQFYLMMRLKKAIHA